MSDTFMVLWAWPRGVPRDRQIESVTEIEAADLDTARKLARAKGDVDPNGYGYDVRHVVKAARSCNGRWIWPENEPIP